MTSTDALRENGRQNRIQRQKLPLEKSIDFMLVGTHLKKNFGRQIHIISFIHDQRTKRPLIWWKQKRESQREKTIINNRVNHKGDRDGSKSCEMKGD